MFKLIMKIFVNDKIRNISILLTIIHCLALMYTPGGPWSHNPREAGFWIAIVSAVTSTIVINKIFVIFATKKEK